MNTSLIAAGNMFNVLETNQTDSTNILGSFFSHSPNGPKWDPMYPVKFLYAEKTWDEWKWSFLVLIAGTAMFLIVISAMTRKAPWMSFGFVSDHPLQVMQFEFTKYLATSSVFMGSVLIIIYFCGAHLYECGKPWLRTTIAYVYHHPLVEWTTAFMYCVFVTHIVYFITTFRIRHDEYLEGNKTRMVNGEMGMRVMIWRTRMQDDTQASGMARIKSEIECQSVESRRVSAFKLLNHIMVRLIKEEIAMRLDVWRSLMRMDAHAKHFARQASRKRRTRDGDQAAGVRLLRQLMTLMVKGEMGMRLMTWHLHMKDEDTTGACSLSTEARDGGRAAGVRLLHQIMNRMMKGEMGMRLMIWRLHMKDEDVVDACLLSVETRDEDQASGVRLLHQIMSRRVKGEMGMRLMILRMKGDDERHLTWSQLLIAVIMYFPALCLLSTVTIIDAISNTVPPGDNILGLDDKALFYTSAVLVAPALFLVKAYVLPPVTDLTLRLAAGSTDELIATRTRFIIYARLFLTIVVPCVCTIIMSQNCHGGWRSLWKPCSPTSKKFDANAVISFMVGNVWYTDSVIVLKTSSICNPPYRLELYTRIFQLGLTHLPIIHIHLTIRHIHISNYSSLG